jgi:hypothetical protein
MRTRLAVIATSVALAIGGLAACSSSQQDVVRSDGGSATAAASGTAEALQSAAQKTTDVGTAKVAMTFDVTGVPGLGATTFTVDGAIDTKVGQSSFTFDVSKLAAALPASQQVGLSAILGDGNVQVVTDASDVYLKVGGLATILGAATGQSWIKVSADSAGAGAVGAPLGDGTQVLKLLEQAGDVTAVGTEQVRGVDTTHYQGTLDVAAALAKASAADRAKAESELGKVGIDPSAVTVPVDVWIGTADGLVRRVQIGVQGVETTTSTATGAVGGTFTLELYDFGQPVAITVPPADQVFTVDPSMLGGLAQLAG